MALSHRRGSGTAISVAEFVAKCAVPIALSFEDGLAINDD
jgi:hypothetical protein